MSTMTHAHPEAKLHDTEVDVIYITTPNGVIKVSGWVEKKKAPSWITCEWKVEPAICISCGAKTDAHGSLPCGH